MAVRGLLSGLRSALRATGPGWSEEFFAAKRTVRWMAKGVRYGVVDKEMYLSFRTNPVYTRGFIAGNVQVPCGIECQTVRHTLEPFHEQFAYFRASVFVYGDADYPAGKRFRNVQVILVGREGHSVCEVMALSYQSPPSPLSRSNRQTPGPFSVGA